MDGGVARERICPFSIGHISLGGIFPLRHISSGGKHVSSSGCWVADGLVVGFGLLLAPGGRLADGHWLLVAVLDVVC